KNFFQIYFVAHGGCQRMNIVSLPLGLEAGPEHWVKLAQTYRQIEYLNRADLFGKPVLQWSDGDIEAALRIYRDCETRIPNLAGPRYHSGVFERELRDTIMTARNVAAQIKAQEQAKIELEKAQFEMRRRQAEEEAQSKENALRE